MINRADYYCVPVLIFKISGIIALYLLNLTAITSAYIEAIEKCTDNDNTCKSTD